MDVNDLRSVVTLLSLAVFIGIVLWAWSKRNQAAFEEAALLPANDDPTGVAYAASEERAP